MKKQKLKKKKRNSKHLNTILKLVPAFFALAVASQALGICSKGLSRSFVEPIRIRMLEFKLMNTIEIEKRDKKSIKIEYHKLKGINKYIKNFLKRNPKWKAEKEVYGDIETGRYILTRVYRTYYKNIEDKEVCRECGRSYDEED